MTADPFNGYSLSIPHRPETWGLGQDHPQAGKKSLKVYQEAVRWRWRQVHGAKKLTGPIELVTVFVIRNPRQDVTNLVKALEDALKGFAFDDDAYVYQQSNQKLPCRGAEEPHARLLIRPYHGDVFDCHTASGGPKPPRKARPPRDVPGLRGSSPRKRAPVGV